MPGPWRGRLFDGQVDLLDLALAVRLAPRQPLLDDHQRSESIGDVLGGALQSAQRHGPGLRPPVEQIGGPQS